MKNPKDILLDATKFPRALETKLPAGAPKISETLADIAGKLPAVPDLPIDIPAPPEPELPEFPALPGAELRRYVTGVEVRPITPTPTPAKREIIPSPAVGVIPEVITRRGM